MASTGTAAGWMQRGGMVVLIAGALLLGSTPSGAGGRDGVALGARPGGGIASGSNLSGGTVVTLGTRPGAGVGRGSNHIGEEIPQHPH